MGLARDADFDGESGLVTIPRTAFSNSICNLSVYWDFFGLFGDLLLMFFTPAVFLLGGRLRLHYYSIYAHFTEFTQLSCEFGAFALASHSS